MKLIALTIGCLLVLASCGSGEAEVKENPASNFAEEKPAQQITDSSAKDTSGTNPDLMMADYIGGIKIGMSLNEVKKILGEPSSQQQLQNWGFDGRWYATYYFSGKGMQMNVGSDDSLGTNPTVSSITAVPPCVFKTGRGVSLGSSLTEVRNAYEAFIDKEQSNDTVVLAGSVYGGLIFYLEKGNVKKIFVGAAGE